MSNLPASKMALTSQDQIFNCVVDPTCTTSGPGVENLTAPGAENQFVK
jgi:hypothetical protein